MRLRRMMLFFVTIVLSWFTFSTQEVIEERTDCYERAGWDGSHFVGTGEYVCLRGVR